MTVFLVPDGLDGERLDTAAARMTGWSRSQLAAQVEAGRLLVDNVVADKPSLRVRAGQMLDIPDLEQRRVLLKPRLADGLRIVHLDEAIVVVDKPSGVAAHPSLGWDGPDVLSHLAAAGVVLATSGPPERQGVVQRLDVGTSGLMVIARTEADYAALKRQFRDHTVQKYYLAVVQGHPDPPAGVIEAPIGRDPGAQWRFAVRADGRPSVTHYETTELFRGAAMLRVRLETGRTHQIRVHMAALRHPIVGDPLYGSDPVMAARLGLDRQWLHAAELGFVHPSSGEPVEFVSAPPADLQRALDTLRA